MNKKIGSQGYGAGFYLFVVYTISYFLGLPWRFQSLGHIRFDLLLGSVLSVFLIVWSIGKREKGSPQITTTNLLFVILAYIVITVPASKWPGTVLRYGLPEFIKTSLFYFFALAFINEELTLKKFIKIYFWILLAIVAEPFFLYYTKGRLGYIDYSMGDTPFARLSGTTNKVGNNPNGLAGIVAITIPFIFSFYGYYKSRLTRTFFIFCVPMLIFTLILTGSRSGLLATLVAAALCVSRGAKFRGIIIMFIIAGFIWMNMGGVYKERYMSIVDENAEGRVSAVGRIEHVKHALKMFSDRPFFGYGVGTYKEANWNIMNESLVSHNLYTGVLVELGFFGFLIYFAFIISIFRNLHKVKQIYSGFPLKDKYPLVLADTLKIVLITELVFSFFAGSPSYYLWFLLGGISAAALRIAYKDMAKMRESEVVLKLADI